MKLIVRAADYGMTESITDGCLRATWDGILTDVGLMTNNYKQAKRAVEEIKKYPHISLGQDLNLVSGMPASDPKDIPYLVGENGSFLSSGQRRVKNLNDFPYEEVYHEMKLQVERFIELVGRKPSYVTGHVLSNPVVDLAMKNIAEEYGVYLGMFTNPGDNPEITIGERWYKTSMRMDSQTQKMVYDANAQGATDVVGHILSGGCNFNFADKYAILVFHCGYYDGDLQDMSSFSVVRGRELQALCSPVVKQWLKDNNVELINFDQFLAERK